MPRTQKEEPRRRSRSKDADTPRVEHTEIGLWSSLQEDTRHSIVALLFTLVALILLLSTWTDGGWLGGSLAHVGHLLFGAGYYLLPALSLLLAVNFYRAGSHNLASATLVAGPLFVLSGLGLLTLAGPHTNGDEAWGGLVGYWTLSPMLFLFAAVLSGIILSSIAVIALLVLFDMPLRLGFLLSITRLFRKGETPDHEPTVIGADEEEDEETEEESSKEKTKKADPTPKESTPKEKAPPISEKEADDAAARIQTALASHVEYIAPPLSLLAGDKGKPGYGDIKANANIIKRTLQNFGIDVEMDEISVGPSITRYALKPAESVRLSKIVALQRELELSLAASPIRIEAPIPGKSLVGIEIPNSQKAMVGLGSLLSSPAWTEKSDPLYVPLGKGISGFPQYMNIAKMPHVLVAGTTGSGKSVTVHNIIVSLLYRNAPETLRFIMVDPKRVELTLYNGIPHLLTPVITDAKKTILTLKWATKEMDRRYDILEKEKVRDISSYHKNVLAPALEKAKKAADKGNPLPENEIPERMPYIMVIIDEMADLMQAYPRELESAIVRLAQMSRAVGIHLILSTQRPSVNVITGLIKANVPARIALQVASQIDSRTILDMSGAENLLGAGDMLYLSSEMPKPIRLQSAFVSEGEVKNVVKHLKDSYNGALGDELALTTSDGSTPIPQGLAGIPEDALTDSGDEDDMYDEAKATVIENQKASTSFLQRRLGLGYARAARIMDMLEERGVVGPADGAKPRDILVRPDEADAGFGAEPTETES